MRSHRRWTWRLRAAGVVLGAVLAWMFVSTPLAQAGEPAPDMGVDSVYVGMVVCVNTPLGRYECGHVTAVNETVCFPQQCLYGLARVSLRSGPSQGAPVYNSAGQRVGVVVGSSGGTTWFDPI